MKDSPESRTFSEAERRRASEHARLRERLERDGWRAHELVVGMGEVNTRGTLVGIACSLPFIAAFIALHGVRPPSSGQLIAGCIAYLALIPLHEGIHGLTWGLCNPQHFKAVEFGLAREYLTPYCTCTQPLAPRSYLAGVLMPGLVLGIVPAVAGTVLGNGLVFALGALMIWGASGDMLVAARVARYIGRGCAKGRLEEPSGSATTLDEPRHRAWASPDDTAVGTPRRGKRHANGRASTIERLCVDHPTECGAVVFER